MKMIRSSFIVQPYCPVFMHWGTHALICRYLAKWTWSVTSSAASFFHLLFGSIWKPEKLEVILASHSSLSTIDCFPGGETPSKQLFVVKKTPVPRQVLVVVDGETLCEVHPLRRAVKQGGLLSSSAVCHKGTRVELLNYSSSSQFPSCSCFHFTVQ